MSYEAANGWREATKVRFPEHFFLSPMRGKEEVFGGGTIEGHADYGHIDLMSNINTILARDLSDVRRSDFVFANFFGADIVSIGTVFELGYAHALDVPVIVVMPEESIHNHIFITNPAAVVVHTLEAGYYALESFVGESRNVYSGPSRNLFPVN
jgi:nucleoside 2-deoxyribosyltransferase